MNLNKKTLGALAGLMLLSTAAGSLAANGSTLISPSALHDLVSQVDPGRLETGVRRLVGFGTRHIATVIGTQIVYVQVFQLFETLLKLRIVRISGWYVIVFIGNPRTVGRKERFLGGIIG